MTPEYVHVTGWGRQVKGAGEGGREGGDSVGRQLVGLAK